MAKPIKRVAVTGGAGQIAYHLLFRIASGEMFGADQPVALNILEVPDFVEGVKGVVLELQDCAFPLLQDVQVGSNPRTLFDGVDYAILLGAKPRSKGMERADLLRDNSKIFIEQGTALNDTASSNVKVLVIGNPCNTNCLIAMSYAPRIPRRNFHALMRLDQNRAVAQLALKSGRSVDEVTRMAIWGNHSATQVPDFLNAKIGGEPVTEVIKDLPWLKNEFMKRVQNRGTEVINVRGKSSTASAANAIVDAIRSMEVPTPPGEWFSSAVYSVGNPYKIDPNLIFSFPVRSKGGWNFEIVQDLKWDDFLKEKIVLSEQELIQERQQVL